MTMLAGLLIWTKLRLVSDIPRTAYADPKQGVQIDDDANPEPLSGESADRADVGSQDVGDR